jgi:mannitol/fructose-specific phosphotransferase system IIA component (Ntr-type)
LAKLAHLTRSEEAVGFLKRRPSKKELLSYIKDWEVRIRGPVEEKI